jgi:hypothetical protein
LFAASSSVSLVVANFTLTQAQALCESIEFNSALTAARMVNFPSAVKINVETLAETVVENCRAFRVNRERLEELQAVLAGTFF